MLNVKGFCANLSFKASLFAGLFAAVAALPVSLSKAVAVAAEQTQQQASQKEEAGTIVSVAGVVFVRADGKLSAGLQPAKPGDKVFPNDVINTSSNGKVKVLMKDKTIVDVGPAALFKVDHFNKNTGTDREADVTMMYGTVRLAVTQKISGKGRFRVRTPSATMGVRGTEFIVKSEVKTMEQVRQAVANTDKAFAAAPTLSVPNSAPGSETKTEVTVLQGQVDVGKSDPASGRSPSADKVVSLTAGMQLATKQNENQLSKPVTLDQNQLASVAALSKVQDNTFARAVVIDSADNGMSGVGEATRAAIAQSFVVPTAPPVSMGDVGFAGTFGANQIFNQPSLNQQAGLKRLRVIVITQ